MKRSMIGLALVGVAAAGCGIHIADRGDTSGQALVADTRAADCDRRASMATRAEAVGPAWGTTWSAANAWALATSSSTAQVERDLRQRHYDDCLGR